MEQSNSSKMQWIIAGSIIAIGIVAAVFILTHGAGAPATGIGATSTSTMATSTGQAQITPEVISQLKKKGTITGNGYTISLDNGNIPPAPDYKSPLVCAASVASDVCTILQQKAQTLSQKIAAKQTDFFAWINLGATRKIAGDYQGAIAAWNYVIKLYPTDPTAYANLGDLYANFVKDYPKAEAKYLKAVALKPEDTSNYLNLYLLYVNPASTLQSTSSARAILQKGIAANPNASDLKAWLSRLQ